MGRDLPHRFARARALGKAHAAGIVHRDVKPENIFLVRDDDSEIAKVLDFGIAQHAASEPNSSNRSILGTPFYMSPEQASGATRVDHRSDLFSLAVIVYQCLTGELPFVGTEIRDVFTQILQAPVPVPSLKAADLPPSFDAWWARASSRDVSDRYQTAKEFAEALTVSLRISEILEVSSLIPRAEVGSTGRISIVAGSLSALSKAQISAGETLAIHATPTLNESYTRTFEPEPMFRKPRLRLFAGLGAAAALVMALAFARGGDNGPPPRRARRPRRRRGPNRRVPRPQQRRRQRRRRCKQPPLCRTSRPKSAPRPEPAPPRAPHRAGRANRPKPLPHARATISAFNDELCVGPERGLDARQSAALS